jgi:peptidoglycan/LPS O-acetylase OafA/YrhL
MEGARGVAILLVFCVHHAAIFGRHVEAYSLSGRISSIAANIGYSGVDLFFVLSGFLIYGIVLRQRFDYAAFIRRRAERIYPVFLVVFALYLILSALFPDQSKIPASTGHAIPYLVANLLFLPGLLHIRPIITVAWSLSYEFFFYLGLPILVRSLGMQVWPRWTRVLFFVAIGICIDVLPIEHVRMAMFLAGIVVYEAISSGIPAKAKSRLWDWVVGALLLISLWPMWLALERNRMDHRVLIMAVSFSGLAIFSFARKGLLHRIFSWDPLRWMGNMSYSYYLSHSLALQGIGLVLHHFIPVDKKSTMLFWASAVLCLPATVFVAAVLFILVEKRYSLVRRRFTHVQKVAAA